MPKSIPIFSSHYSLGSGTLTLYKLDDLYDQDGPESIIKICKDYDFKELYLRETSLSGLVAAIKNTKDIGVKLNFALTLVLCENYQSKNPDSLVTEHKVNIWVKNDDGYHRLIKIYSDAAVNGFYYRPRLDCNKLKEYWDNKDLGLTIPMYYSYLHRNLMHNGKCIPDFSFTKPALELQENCLPFNFLLEKQIDKKSDQNKWPVLKTHNIYYKDRKDFLYFSAYKCMDERTTLEKPNLDHFCSNEFCLEEWTSKNV